jgi:hypothetical protein
MTDVYRRPRTLAEGDPSIRRRIDVTRLFTQRPSERLTAQEVQQHTVGSTDEVRTLLEELTNVGWLCAARNPDDFNRVVYWRES